MRVTGVERAIFALDDVDVIFVMAFEHLFYFVISTVTWRVLQESYNGLPIDFF